MKKTNICLWIGLLMLICAMVFVGYALNHPTATLTIKLFNKDITGIIYILYVVLMVFVFIIGTVVRVRKHGRKACELLSK